MRRRRGGRKPYYYWILTVLREQGGSATKALVCSKVHDKMRSQLSDPWYDQDVKSHEPRWQNEVAFARDDLVKKGWLEPLRVADLWEISDKGRKWLETAQPTELDDGRIKIDTIG